VTKTIAMVRAATSVLCQKARSSDALRQAEVQFSNESWLGGAAGWCDSTVVLSAFIKQARSAAASRTNRDPINARLNVLPSVQSCRLRRRRVS